MLIESSVTGANRGCEPGTSSSWPKNGTTGTAYTSTGGGSPGSSVRGQHGYRDALLNNNRKEEGELNNTLNFLRGESTGTRIQDPTRVPLYTTGIDGQKSTAAVTPSTARRDDG